MTKHSTCRTSRDGSQALGRRQGHPGPRSVHPLQPHRHHSLPKPHRRIKQSEGKKKKKKKTYLSIKTVAGTGAFVQNRLGNHKAWLPGVYLSYPRVPPIFRFWHMTIAEESMHRNGRCIWPDHIYTHDRHDCCNATRANVEHAAGRINRRELGVSRPMQGHRNLGPKHSICQRACGWGARSGVYVCGRIPTSHRVGHKSESEQQMSVAPSAVRTTHKRPAHAMLPPRLLPYLAHRRCWAVPLGRGVASTHGEKKNSRVGRKCPPFQLPTPLPYSGRG
ncbi:hypothetical protein MAPG_01804 [Magnaporthiopsis poae ATCC 64411]|uniref:Uncharacterized protein n=1 Tax=Magnaporthiopsis poae (strain ATCC 64411 / 73-15) TaxID=644358 RepID=A0A0C4DPN3_MAGP6|nr:hypothetical protein MAPG_01804 [Magnaporthiopsis poae ATCC 64411]